MIRVYFISQLHLFGTLSGCHGVRTPRFIPFGYICPLDQMDNMKLAVVGVTGLVGQEICRVLEEHSFQVDEFLPVASARSKGKKVTFQGKEHEVITIEEGIAAKPDIAIFSAGGGPSMEFGPKYAEAGATVIDNSSAWRMSPDHKLIVPEVNGHTLTQTDKIIANPNCSTIQMVLTLAPLHKAYTVKRVVVSTYQSVTGTGTAAVEQLMNERAGRDGEMAYPYAIDLNALPHIDVFLDNDYTKEEMKMVNETQKILGDDTVKVTATAVRLPVMGGHSESVNVELGQEYKISDIRDILSKSAGIVVQDDPANLVYPMPLDAHGKDEVFVGRIRRDETQPNTVNMWIVADNLRKGAATNAVQIAEYIRKQGWVS